MLYVPFGNDFQWSYSNITATRPTTTSMGTSITAGTAPTMGAWTQVVSSANMAQEGYGILIGFNNGSTSAATRNYLVDVGVDNAGGSAYVVKIPYLLAGHATTYGLGSSAIWYYFPLYIPLGSSVALRAAGNVTTAFNAVVSVFGQPRRPDAIRCGSMVFSFGQTTATSTGTTITLGTTAEGAWTQVGSAVTESLWWWQTGYTCIDTTMTAATIHLDLAAGNSTTKKILYENAIIQTTAAEQISSVPVFVNSYNNVAPGDLIYIRGQHSSTADTSTSVMAWGLGG